MLGELWAMFVELFMISAIGLYHFLRRHHRYIFILPILVAVAIHRFVFVFSSLYYQGIAERDVEVIRQLLTGDPFSIGASSIPGIVPLGPFYAHFLTPILLFISKEPIGIAMVASLFAIATTFIVYIIGRRLFNLQAGIFAAGLYGLSPLVLSYMYESWSIDIVPFFIILLIYLTFRATSSAKSFWLHLASGFLLALAVQLHQLSFFLLVVLPVTNAIAEIVVHGKRFFIPLIKHYLALVLGVILGSVPFLWYEATHGFTTLKTFTAYVQTAAAPYATNEAMLAVPATVNELFARITLAFPSADQSIYYTSDQLQYLTIFSAVLLVASLVSLIFVKNKVVLLHLGGWFLGGALTYAMFEKDVFMQHFSPMYPVVFLLLGNMLGTLFHLFDQERVKLAKQLISSTAESTSYKMIQVDATNTPKLWAHRLCIGISIWLFAIIALLNFSVLPFERISKEDREVAKEVAKLIKEESRDKAINFAQISTPASEGKVYIQALKQAGKSPVVIQYPELDPDRKTVTDQLFVVCEDLSCTPLQSSLSEIRGFGSAVIIKNWDVEGVKVYRLIHPDDVNEDKKDEKEEKN